LGSILLSEGEPPEDPRFRPEGAASAWIGGLGVHARPFAARDPEKATAASGIWASADFGGTTTGGRVRPVLDVFAGYDFLMDQGRVGIGPMAGLVHVFQSDDELRPADANIVLGGLHVMFDFGRKREPVSRDRDGDGIVDERDRCPDTPEDKDGFEDEDGCPDLDNDQDGIPDDADSCPNEPEDKDGFEDEDGCPDPDNDKDGILDAVDQCPNEPEDLDGWKDDDGCPEDDDDTDGDGILNKDDLCPNEPETMNGYADEDGCPDELQVRVTGDKIELDDKVHFETNRSVIRPLSYPLLGRLAKLLSEHPEYVHIEVQGHTDPRGGVDFNQKLSEDRAKAVLEFLVSRGIERDRLSFVGFGATRPVEEGHGEHVWFKNRRVEFLITREVREIVR
jgi:outer membrane protein OmpA-like peptidoglycan-associated protein